MELEDIMLREISQIEKDKYCTISLICGTLGLPPKKQTKALSLWIQKTDWWLPEVRGGGGGGGGGQ